MTSWNIFHAVLLLCSVMFVRTVLAQVIPESNGLSLDNSVAVPAYDDAVLDYVLRKQANENLRSANYAFKRAEPFKRNRYRLCSINAVACFGRRK